MDPSYVDYSTPEQKRFVRNIILCSVLAIGLILLSIIYHFLTTGVLQITTNDSSSTILIQETAPDYKTIGTGNATGHYTKRLGHGTYTITAKNGYASAQQIVTLTGSSKKVTLDLDQRANQQGTLEPVSDLGAYSIVADPNSVKFIDRNQTPNKLYQIDKNNALTQLIPNIAFDRIAWADSSFGVGTSDGTLSAINGSGATSISTPETPSSFAVAPNHDVYISDGKNVYRGQNGTGFEKVLTADPDETLNIISASNDTVLLSNQSQGSVREGELITLQKKGGKSEIDGEIYEGVWTKNGKYLALSGDTNGIYDTTLHKISDLPINNVGSLNWIDDDTLVYADANLLWEYTISTHHASVLATTNSGAGSISEITPSSDGATLYVAVQNADISNGYSFYLTRYPLHNAAQPDPMLQKISMVLPNTVSTGCRAGYANLTKLSITVYTAQSSEQDCITATKNYLQGYDIDYRSINFQYVPS